jgi:class I fructose-bisphosphate aldolase
MRSPMVVLGDEDVEKQGCGSAFSSQQAIDAVVRSANETMELVSDGERAGDEAMLEARQSMEAGATRLIFGRNVWQRDRDESLQFVVWLREIPAKYPSQP